MPSPLLLHSESHCYQYGEFSIKAFMIYRKVCKPSHDKA